MDFPARQQWQQPSIEQEKHQHTVTESPVNGKDRRPPVEFAGKGTKEQQTGTMSLQPHHPFTSSFQSMETAKGCRKTKGYQKLWFFGQNPTTIRNQSLENSRVTGEGDRGATNGGRCHFNPITLSRFNFKRRQNGTEKRHISRRWRFRSILRSLLIADGGGLTTALDFKMYGVCVWWGMYMYVSLFVMEGGCVRFFFILLV